MGEYKVKQPMGQDFAKPYKYLMGKEHLIAFMTPAPHQEVGDFRGRASRGCGSWGQLLLGPEGVEAQKLHPLRNGRRKYHWLVQYLHSC